MMDARELATADQAWADYRALADSVGVEVRTVAGEDPWAAGELLEEIWGVRPVEPALLVSLAHSGGYATIAVDADGDGGDRVLGAAVGFFAQPLGKVLHSHVAGVRPGLGRPGVGRAMKLHQRAWCLELGVTQVTWTFDPLVARNAHVNIARLGTEVDEYLIDFYGNMPDGINAGQRSDRVVVRWHLDRPYLPGGYSRPEPGPAPLVNTAPWVNTAPLVNAAPLLEVAPDGWPKTNPTTASAAVTLAIPSDIEELRAVDPALASAWRLALRDAMAPPLADGWRVTGFESPTGYLLERPTP